MQKSSLKDLQKIPGIGRVIARDLYSLGLHSAQDLKGQDPEELYSRLCQLKGTQVDRCMLYVFRCAVYYASNQEHEPNLLKWWNWKDRL
jgi:nucleotidyltransferase/DNA polymerase involved in DNA repair